MLSGSIHLSTSKDQLTHMEVSTTNEYIYANCVFRLRSREATTGDYWDMPTDDVETVLL